MQKKIIFLSGPMRGIPREEGVAWREKVIDYLNSDIFVTLHAYRGRIRPQGQPDPILDPKMAVARDKQDILRSSIMLVNDTFDNDRYPQANMIGTAMEIIFARTHHIPVIVFGNARKGNYWLDAHIDLRVDTLEQACEFINRQFSF